MCRYAVRFRFHPLDLLLLLMTIIWGGNFSVIKVALEEIPGLGFNALRLLLASSLFIIALAVRRARGAAEPLTRRDWLGVVGLALVGHFAYQLLFMGGLARTTVANSSLIFGCTPVTVALLTAALGQEHVGRARWAGAALSLAGLALVVGPRVAVSGESVRGDAMIVGAMLCWAVYTVGSRHLLQRLTPLAVTGYSMGLGSVLYAPFGVKDLVRLDWRSVSAGAWSGLVFSAVFGLAVAYMIWYTAVQRLGNTRTSVYSNVVPLVAMTIAALWLGERVTRVKIAGACAILGGVFLTKVEAGERPPAPPEA